MKGKRGAALTLAALAASGFFAGCSVPGQTGNAAGSQTAGNGAQDEEGSGTIPGGPTVTYWCELNDNVSALYQNLGDTPFARGLMENTGVNIVFRHPPAGQTDEQFSMLMAGGDLPDVMEYAWTQYPGGPEKAISDGKIIALNDVIDAYCPNLKAYLESHPEVDRQCKTDEGHYYMFPFIRGDQDLTLSSGLWIRQDWLDELGLSMPETIDEWHTVLTAFRDKKGCTAPFTYEYNMSELTETLPFQYAFNTVKTFYVGDDGEVHFGPAEENYRAFLENMHQWYEEGLIDPDIATQQLDQVSAKVVSGQSGASAGWTGSRAGVWMTEALKSNPGFNLQPAPVPTLVKGDTPAMGQMDNLVTSNGGVAITTGCRDYGTAARLLDWGYSEEGHMYYNFGTEGVSYTVQDGEPVYTDEVLKNPDGLPAAQAMSAYIRGNYNGPFVQDLRYLKQYYVYDGQKKANDTWYVQDASKHLLPPITPTAAESVEFSSIMNEINAYRDDMTLQFILGTVDLNEFDDFIETLEEKGIERALEIENAALQRYNAR